MRARRGRYDAKVAPARAIPIRPLALLRNMLVASFRATPLDAIDRLPGNSPDKKLKTAFTVMVGDPIHIVHYTFDEVYDQDGNEWRA